MPSSASLHHPVFLFRPFFLPSTASSFYTSPPLNVLLPDRPSCESVTLSRVCLFPQSSPSIELFYPLPPLPKPKCSSMIPNRPITSRASPAPHTTNYYQNTSVICIANSTPIRRLSFPPHPRRLHRPPPAQHIIYSSVPTSTQ